MKKFGVFEEEKKKGKGVILHFISIFISGM